MNDIKKIKANRICFIICLGLLILFAVFGQISCDEIALASRRGQYWEYQRGLPYLMATIGIICLAVGLIYLLIRVLTVKRRVTKILAVMLGIAIVAWMLLISGLYIYRSIDSSDYYYAGWWIGYVNKLDEERNLWSKTHWFGKGDEYYQYSYEVFVNAPSEEYRADEEPYHSAVEERCKAETIYQFFNSDTMLNVLSYFYGRWVWLVYSIIAVVTVSFGISLIATVDSLWKKTLFFVAWLLFAIITIMPVLNGCGLVYDGAFGPPFTGYGEAYWQFGVFITAPSIGIILGLSEKTPE